MEHSSSFASSCIWLVFNSWVILTDTYYYPLVGSFHGEIRECFFSVRIFLAIFFQLRLLPGHRSCHVVFPDSSGSYNTAINTEYLVPRIRLNSRSRIITEKASWRIFPDFPLSPMLVFPEVIILTAIIMTVQRPSGERNNSITMWDIGGPL